MWQRKLESATRKQISGQLLKPSGHGKGSSPRSPWYRKGTHQSKAVGERETASQAGLGGEASNVEPALHSPTPRHPSCPPGQNALQYPKLRWQGTVSQQCHILPQPGICWRGLNSKHLHTRARLGSHWEKDSRDLEI